MLSIHHTKKLDCFFACSNTYASFSLTRMQCVLCKLFSIIMFQTSASFLANILFGISFGMAFLPELTDMDDSYIEAFCEKRKFLIQSYFLNKGTF